MKDALKFFGWTCEKEAGAGMTVADLIAALEQMPPDAPVEVNYEGAGMTSLENVGLFVRPESNERCVFLMCL